MSEGHIQQQGTPRELFENPVNQFVAGFIGSPTMNFMDGQLARENDRLTVRGDGFQLPLDPGADARIGGARSNEIVVGIRPSAFSLDPAGRAPIALQVIVAEYLGTNSVLATRCGASDVLVEVASAHLPKSGEMITFAVRPQDVMVFDKATGRTL
jgi:multiple sugar transport system ATP-binding protein